MAHEMAHVANRDVLIASVAAGLAAIVSAIANAVQFSTLFGSTSSSGDDEQSSLIGALAFAPALSVQRADDDRLPRQGGAGAGPRDPAAPDDAAAKRAADRR
jgi:F0F1-type ATP synthase membrane subunit c/vacuolar-type H+-ATPase subunit K